MSIDLRMQGDALPLKFQESDRLCPPCKHPIIKDHLCINDKVSTLAGELWPIHRLSL